MSYAKKLQNLWFVYLLMISEQERSSAGLYSDSEPLRQEADRKFLDIDSLPKWQSSSHRFSWTWTDDVIFSGNRQQRPPRFRKLWSNLQQLSSSQPTTTRISTNSNQPSDQRENNPNQKKNFEARKSQLLRRIDHHQVSWTIFNHHVHITIWVYGKLTYPFYQTPWRHKLSMTYLDLEVHSKL